MISKKVEEALNNQIMLEEHSSRIYLAMASWCETTGYPGAAAFLHAHVDEERMHMSKLIKYLNDKGGHTKIQALKAPQGEFKSLSEVFEIILHHEEFISKSINDLFEIAFTNKDYTTSQFLQWYIDEQIEEESLFKGILDQFRLAGNNKGGLFHLDKELGNMMNTTSTEN